MCGIAGYIGQRGPTTLERMLARLLHRGPDDGGRHLERGIALGARRLKVIDPAGGHQPISNESGTVWVALNGEIYNYRELREELIQKGHRFATNCDTEVLAHLYEQEGEQGVMRLRGMFAYALWDREQQLLLLVRDRLGIKPLYYASATDTEADLELAFASELPSLLEALPSPTLLPEAIGEYLRLLYVPGPGTVFRGIRQVRPGELLRVREGRIEPWQYYDAGGPIESHSTPSHVEAAEQFRERLRETVKAHLVSDVPLGLFLSGGLDSGAALAMMRQVSAGPIRTFSIGYEEQADRSFDELGAARILADHFGAHHHEERLKPDAARLLPKVISGMAEPFADSSAIPTYLVSEVARRSVTVALTGIGGDELFGGYPRYLGLRLARRYAAIPAPIRKAIASHIAPRIPESTSSRNRRGRIKRFLRDGSLPLAQQYVKWVTFLPPEWGASAFTDAFREHGADDGFERRYLGLFESWPSSDPADRAMGLDLQTYLPDDLLRMGDRLSMAHSLELRVPFCDHELLAFARTIPPALRFSDWKLKGFMRNALRPLLPATIVNRSKSGFQVPIARWLKEDLHDMVHDTLSERTIRQRGYVRPEYVRWLIERHESGSHNFSDQIYALLVLELWQRDSKLEAG